MVNLASDVIFKINGENINNLIGYHGETLEAVQYIVNYTPQTIYIFNKGPGSITYRKQQLDKSHPTNLPGKNLNNDPSLNLR